jgi:hypothetical protein
MTEEQWNTCPDPTPMLEFLRSRVSDRKLRLYACACCRRVWHLLLDERSRKAVEFTERLDTLSEGPLERTAIKDAAVQAAGVLSEQYRQRLGDLIYSPSEPLYQEAWMYLKAANAATVALSETAWDAAFRAAELTAVARRLEQEEPPQDPERAMLLWNAERQQQVHLVRDLFGNPFCPVTIDLLWLSWNDASVVKLAKATYEERAFDRLAILADALEDAGCSDAVILDHLRAPGPHVRGCHVIDLLLAQS